MAYDELTTERFRDALHTHLGDMSSVEEKKMMGGICFMLNGNMVGGADMEKDTGLRRFMFRMGKENHEVGLALPGAIPMEMGGRKMRGFFFVEEEACDDEALAKWMEITVGFVEKLPPK